ncbi:hypothetical protein HPP92_002081 [Vanilla planifolia]|uniref:Uncharacterized protein n=1 Tax=Vanilla planifolia TaxID=51239 RepID=A0A835RRV8_VANPL|nr:hypothetical protein HPP92_002081 [Vanilla planifolia]
MQLMSVDGLTRENVASHLQKYRLYLKRMQGLSCSAVGASGVAATPGSILVGDVATEQLFAGNPIPYQFLGRGFSGAGQEPLMQFIGPPSLQHPPMAAAVQQQYYHQRHMERFGSPMVGGGFEYGIHSRGRLPGTTWDGFFWDGRHASLAGLEFL